LHRGQQKKEELRAKARAEEDADQVSKSMSKALREAELQEEQAKVAYDGINAEISANDLMSQPQMLPFVRRDENVAMGASSSSSTGVGHIDWKSHQSAQMPTTATVPAASGSTAAGAGTRPVSNLLRAWDETPDIPPPTAVDESL
jgi:hypothetical protein